MSIAAMFSNPVITSIVVKALVVGVFVSLCASLLGVSLVLKRYSMIGDGLSHVGFGAIAIATALNLQQEYTLEISVPIVVVAAFCILRLSEHSKIKGDAAIALLSTSAIAVGSLIYEKAGTGSSGDMCSSLFGNTSILNITNKDLLLSLALSVVVLVLFGAFYNRIFSITFDENFGQATGIRVGTYKMLIAILTAITIVLGMRMLGTVMISGMIIFPALTSMRVCKSFRAVILCSAVVSVICFVFGFFTASLLGLRTGPTVITVDLMAFLLFSVAGRLTGKG
jgi:zinc transport system permease protein